MSKKQKIQAGLVGVTGYTGMELARILAYHPEIELQTVTSRKEAGKSLRQLYPHLQGLELAELVVSEPDVSQLAADCSLVFLAVPHGTAMDMAKELVQAGVRVVDLSADFRLQDQGVYAQWYGLEHRCPSLIEEAVYGLPELYATQIAKANLIANPGCYPTSVILGLYPALNSKLIQADNLIIDSKSGASGAGRKAVVGSIFCEVHDNFKAYNLGRHRHTPEIEQELGKAAGKMLNVSFNPHLLPIERGILSTIYGTLNQNTDVGTVHSIYEEFYATHPWVRVLPLGQLPQTRWVRGTMYCDLGLVIDPRTNRLIIVAAIDNLCRGASGQAVANANIMYKLAMETGLNQAPAMP